MFKRLDASRQCGQEVIDAKSIFAVGMLGQFVVRVEVQSDDRKVINPTDELMIVGWQDESF
jgi:hypothetical protein